MAIFKSIEDVDLDLIEMFVDKFRNDVNKFNDLIEGLNDSSKYNKNLAEFFRIFHNLKATTGFFGVNEIFEISKKTESVIATLQKDNPPIEKRIFNWLLDLKEQFEIWLEEFEANADKLSPTNPKLNESLSVNSVEKKSSEEILKDLTILYINYNQSKIDKQIHILSDFTKNIYFCKNGKEAVKIYKEKLPDIIITDTILPVISGFKLIKYIKRLNPNTPIIVLSSIAKIEYKIQAKFLGIESYFIKDKVTFEEFTKTLFKTAETYFSESSIKITNKNIKEIVDKLPPLPSTIFEIQKICDDSESSIHDLIEVVKKDPLVSASILKSAKAPIFGFKDVHTVDKAVSLFGKSTTKAIAFAGMMYDKFKIDLSPYSLNEVKFSEISQQRAKLMIKWYSKVSFHKLVILATSVLIGNIGQIVIANEVKKLKKVKKFKQLMEENGRREAELNLFNITTEEVTADILNYWGLDDLLVDSIRYSYNLNTAYSSVVDYAVANRVVFELIDLEGKRTKKILPELEKILIEKDLDINLIKQTFNIL